MINKIDYSKLSLDELKALKEEYYEKAKLYDIKQYAMKIALNSVYGANANRFFKYYSLENASAITQTGQIILQTAMDSINKYLNNILKTDNIDYVVYGDTDSVVGGSIVSVNNIDMPIEVFFNKQDSYIKKDEFNRDYIKEVKEISQTPSLNKNTGEIEHKQIKYVMKHRVKKRMFRITYNERSVVVTQDHSIIVKREGIYLDIRPSELKEGDKIILI